MAYNSEFPNGNNYYEILEVSPNAPQNEIHEAFYRAKKTYSPDSPALYSMFSPEEARELMKLIEEAFSVLGNQALRKEYDKKLKQDHSAPLSDMNHLSHQTFTDHAENSPFPSNDMIIPEAAALDDFDPLHEENRSSSPAAENSEKVPSGSTLLSSYEIDQNLEEEISQAVVLDGPFLKKVREYKKVSLEKLSDHTRVSRTYLRAVEENDYKSLPAAVFIRGFVTQIAKVLDLDASAVATCYMKLYKDTVKK